MRRLVLVLLSFVCGDDFGVFGLGQYGFGVFSAHAISLQFDAVGVVE